MIEQVVRLMDETNRDVRDNLGRTGFAELLVLSVGHIRIRSQAPDELRLSAVFPPKGELSRSEEIAIIVQQFLKAGTRGIGELDLNLGRGLLRFTSFQNILFSRARRLDHLIDRTIAFR